MLSEVSVSDQSWWSVWHGHCVKYLQYAKETVREKESERGDCLESTVCCIKKTANKHNFAANCRELWHITPCTSHLDKVNLMKICIRLKNNYCHVAGFHSTEISRMVVQHLLQLEVEKWRLLCTASHWSVSVIVLLSEDRTPIMA